MFFSQRSFHAVIQRASGVSNVASGLCDRRGSARFAAIALACALGVGGVGAVLPQAAIAQSAAAVGAPHAAPGVPLEANQVEALLPPSVYFQAKTAPLQLRNAAATTFANGAILWVSLVDTSGYATSVQEKYQFYLVTEGPLRFGGTLLLAGAYGGGFLRDGFILMDLGGHTLAQGPVQADAAFPRPRPLQIVADSPSSVKLYLGRRWVLLRADPSAGTPK